MQSCASLKPRPVPISCDGRFEALFPAAPKAAGLEIIGKVRMELPQYRIRGFCRIFYLPDHLLRIDFQHSSLFSALREDVTVFVGDSLAIYDRERDRFFAGDSSLAILRRAIGERVEPDDILYAMLLAIPACPELEGREIDGPGRWELEARWRDRAVSIRGERGTGPREFKQCFAGERRCYIIRYDSYASVAGTAYPRRLRLERERGMERIDFEVTEIKEIKLTPSMFDPTGLEAR